MPEITDDKGRKIDVKQLDPGEFLDLLEASGEASANQGYIAYASVVAAARGFDTVPEPFPTSKMDIKALARKLGSAALGMVAKAIGEEMKVDAGTLATAGN
jgi:hypothetical protein